MGEWIKLTAADGNELSAYKAKPVSEPIGAVVVVQEIFGVNKSIRGVVDQLAEQGYLAIAPAIFDRFEKGVDIGYGPEDMKKAFSLYPKLDPNVTLLDVAAAYEEVKKTCKSVAVMGFCYGGLMSWISAVRGENVKMQPACAVGYYPGGVGNVATEEPSCPVLLHFGLADSHIGEDQREAVASAHPEVEIYTYEGAGHGFANPDRPDYNEAAAQLAWGRTLGFIRTHVA
jgi:carboxymethylenebutenolidase